LAANGTKEIIIRTTSNTISQRLGNVQPQAETYRRSFRRLLRRHRKKLIRYGLLVANTAILVGVLVLISNSQSSSEIARQSLQSNGSAKAAANPLDQLSSADIAVNVASLTALPEANSVKNHADSFNASLTTQQIAGDVVVAKPQIVAGGQAKSAKDLVKYTTVAGDTVSALAQRFGITSDSIRWSNGLTGDRLNAGRQLLIPPVNGIVYTVKAGDTVASIAQRYNANKDLLVTFNDAEIAGIRTGQVIVIPNATPPASSGSSFAWGGSYTAVYSSNGYDYGWCTWWAAKRRQEIGKPIPSNLGNAVTWARLAQRAGYAVDGSPRAGDVAYYKFIGGLGHVGFVEQVNPDGSIWISDMNYYGVSEIGGSTAAGGWGRRSFHLVQPGEVSGYLFIH
jgi:surface antigen